MSTAESRPLSFSERHPSIAAGGWYAGIVAFISGCIVATVGAVSGAFPSFAPGGADGSVAPYVVGVLVLAGCYCSFRLGKLSE